VLGNFVVKVALRITDARQEVGTAVAARGPSPLPPSPSLPHRDTGRREDRGNRRCIVGASERASEMKKRGRKKEKREKKKKERKERHYSIMRAYRGPSDAFTRLLLFSLALPSPSPSGRPRRPIAGCRRL